MRNETKRKEKYNMLRRAGYDSRTANEFKDRSFKTVVALCKIQQDGKQAVDARIADLLKS